MNKNISPQSPTARAVASLVLATAIWGAMFPVAKFILGEMDPVSMTLLRYGIAAPLFLLVLAWREGWQSLRPRVALWPLLALGGLGFAGFNLLMFYGIRQAKPEHGAIVMALQPLIAAMIVWVRSGKRPAARSFAALVLAIVGVALLVTNGNLAVLAAHTSLLPMLMMITAGTCWVLYSMGAARYPDWSPLRYTALSCSAGVVVLLVLWLLADYADVVRLPAAGDWSAIVPALAYVTVFAALIAVISWNNGIRAIGAQGGMLFINVVPLTALLVGVLRGHAFGHYELLGAALVLASLCVNQLGGLRRRPRALQVCAQPTA